MYIIVFYGPPVTEIPVLAVPCEPVLLSSSLLSALLVDVLSAQSIMQSDTDVSHSLIYKI